MMVRNGDSVGGDNYHIEEALYQYSHLGLRQHSCHMIDSHTGTTTSTHRAGRHQGSDCQKWMSDKLYLDVFFLTG